MDENRSTSDATRRDRPTRPGPNFAVPGLETATGAVRTRLHCLDALRATAILLVVTLHALLAYTHFDIPGMVWGVREPSAHLVFDVLCWSMMAVSMPVFFTISGFLAAEIHEARGPVGYLKNRAGRIVGPFFAGVLLVLPFCFYAWSYGWMVSGRCTLREILRTRFRDPAIEADVLGPAHLWFLEYLAPMLLAYWAARKFGPASWSRRLRWLNAAWAPLALAIPTALILWASRAWSGIDAALDRHNSFVPIPLRLLHQSAFFAAGAALRHVQPGLDRLAKFGGIYLLAAVPTFAARAWLLQRDFRGGLDGPSALLSATTGGILSWLATFGLIGSYRRLLNRPIPSVRYLADSSYWIFLVHMPVVGLIQADLYGVPLPLPAKFGFTLATTLLLGLASYEVLVRRTAIGQFLNGGKRILSHLRHIDAPPLMAPRHDEPAASPADPIPVREHLSRGRRDASSHEGR